MSRGKLRQNRQSRSANLGRCGSKDNSQNVEIIDLDSVDADVVIIDAPGPSHQSKRFVRKEGTSSPDCVISIDDDDNDESGTDSPSETSGSQYGHPRNRYGLGCTSETESPATGTSGSKDSSGVVSSDSEGSDCEILDDSSGSVRQEWERAHSRKTMPPDRVESTPCENVECHLYKSFVNSFNSCFGESSSSRNLFGHHEDGATCSVPNADSSGNLPKDNVSGKHQPWYEQGCGSFVPGMHREEIRERVSPFFIIRPCSYRKGKTVFSGNGVRSSEEKVVGEEIAKEADNGVRSPEKLAGDEIAKEADNGVRSLKKNFEGLNAKEASMDMENEMSGKGNEKGEPSRNIEPSLMQDGDIASEVKKHEEKIREESALVSMPEANTELEHDECLVGDREKHKESDEYRRAAEEEWASRQKQLRIQAEEAQRLKKRKKAETLRLLDMEKRQKQRLEEMRENQKKNEETLSLKEELRSEVRKDLERMEKTCTDMTSILRGLGIPVGGGLVPSPNQVKSAYKKAVLKFHPDRVQANDVRQQVRAEEIFKFISRLKEKLLLAP